LDPDDIEDMTEELILLMANATGISELAKAQMPVDDEFDVDHLRSFVSLVIRDFWRPPMEPDFDIFDAPNLFSTFELLVALAGILIFAVMLAVLLIALARRARRVREEEEEYEMLAELGPVSDMDAFAMAIGKTAVADEIGGEEVSLEIKEQNLKRQIKLFVDQNPEIAAQLIKTLLKGDEAGG
jgi:flagellar M-ring protein FliF